MPLVVLVLVLLTAFGAPLSPAPAGTTTSTLQVVSQPLDALPPVTTTLPPQSQQSRHASGHVAPTEVTTTGVSCDPKHHGDFCTDGAEAPRFLARLLLLAPVVQQRAAPGATSCIAQPPAPTGETEMVHGSSKDPGIGRVWTFRVEIEEGLGVDGTCFAIEALRILNDPRGWGADGDLSFQWVDGDDYDFRLVLASPDTTDSLCRPLRTGGVFSCRNGELVVLNQQRWAEGATPFGDDLTLYRQYLVNHEVGHRLGHGHRTCPKPGAPAPIMMQQTKGVGACTPTGWPLDDER